MKPGGKASPDADLQQGLSFERTCFLGRENTQADEAVETRPCPVYCPDLTFCPPPLWKMEEQLRYEVIPLVLEFSGLWLLLHGVELPSRSTCISMGVIDQDPGRPRDR